MTTASSRSDTQPDTPVRRLESRAPRAPGLLAVASLTAVAAAVLEPTLALAGFAAAAFVALALLGGATDPASRRAPLVTGPILAAASLALAAADLGAIAAPVLGLAVGIAAPAAIAIASGESTGIDAATAGGPARGTLGRIWPTALTVIAALIGMEVVLAAAPAAVMPAAGVLLLACLVAAAAVPAPRPATPRALLPLPLRVPRSARRDYRRACRWALAAGGLPLLLLDLLPAIGPRAEAAVLAAGVLPLSVGLVFAVRAADPLRLGSTLAAVLARAAFALTCTALVVALIPPLFHAAAGAAVLVPLILSAVRRPHRPAVRLHARGSRGYRQAVRRFDARSPLNPELAGVATSTDDVVALVRQARLNDVGLRMHSTGHSTGTVRPIVDGALIKVAIDEAITVDPQARTVRIPAGATWGEVLRVVAPHGLGVPHGSSPDVGAIGYLLRGGASFYGRELGVAANSVTSIEAVLADGRHLHVDATRDPELFWALRGGGNGFGIVTAMTVRLFELTAIVTGIAVWPFEVATEIATAWEQATDEAPRRLTSCLRVMTLPAFPGIPRAITKQPIVVVDGIALAGTTEEIAAAQRSVEALLAPLRAVRAPLLDSWHTASPLEALATHMDPPIGAPHAADHQLLTRLGTEGIDAFLDAIDPRAPGVSLSELRHLGGAFAEAPAGGGAVSTFAGDFSVWTMGLTGKIATDDIVRARLARLRTRLTPWDTGMTIPTFAPDPSIPQRPLDTTTASNVSAVRQRVDGDGVFSGEVAPGTE